MLTTRQCRGGGRARLALALLLGLGLGCRYDLTLPDRGPRDLAPGEAKDGARVDGMAGDGPRMDSAGRDGPAGDAPGQDGPRDGSKPKDLKPADKKPDQIKIDLKTTDKGAADHKSVDQATPVPDGGAGLVEWAVGACASSKLVGGGTADCTGSKGSLQISRPGTTGWEAKCQSNPATTIQRGCLIGTAITVVPVTVTSSANPSTADCLAVNALVGGGCTCLDGSAYIQASFPQDTQRWTCRCSQGLAQAVAICKYAGLSVQRLQGAGQTCPAGRLLGGGCNQGTGQLEGSYPNPSFTGWVCSPAGTTYTLCAQ